MIIKDFKLNPTNDSKPFALITGATSGIGEACVYEFLETGYSVLGVGTNQQRLTAIAHENGNFVPLAADLSTDSGLHLIERCLTDHNQPLAALVNCAGIAKGQAFADITLSDWQRIMHLNVTVPFQVAQLALPYLAKGLGCIVNVSSIAGRSASKTLGAHYTTSKAALIGMTRHLAKELGSLGIRVNATAPSQTLTPMLDEAMTEAQKTALAASIPLKRLADAREQAAVIAFLCSKKASYISGAIIDVNGGQL